MKNLISPGYLLSERDNALYYVIRQIRRASSLALFFDYDGTLTPIRKLPSQAVLDPATRFLLRKLSLLPLVRVSIVTGRGMTDIRRLISLPNISYAANHGFELHFYDGTSWINPRAQETKPILRKLRSRLRQELRRFPLAMVEDKHATLSIHFRNVPAAQVHKVRSIVRQVVKPYDTQVRITHGKKVLEIRPQGTWGKMEAVRELSKTFPQSVRPLSLFIGDDTTDEDVFRELRRSGVTIRVGKKTGTAARYYVRSVEEVVHILKLILMIRSPWTHSS